MLASTYVFLPNLIKKLFYLFILLFFFLIMKWEIFLKTTVLNGMNMISTFNIDMLYIVSLIV